MRRWSVRVRVTVLVTVSTAVLAVSAIWLGTARVRASLIADLLDSAADLQGEELAFLDEVGDVGPLPGDVVVDPFYDESAELTQVVADLARADLYRVLVTGAGLSPAEGLVVVAAAGDVYRVTPRGAERLEVGRHGVEVPVVVASSLFDLWIEAYDVEGIFADPLAGFLVDPGPREVSVVTGVRERRGLQLLVWARTDDVERSIARFRSVSWSSVPVVLVLAAAASWALAGRALAPVRRISARAASISAGTLHDRVPEPGTGDEIDELARTVNAMLERLETGDRRRRRFVSDASHELRSPVAALRAAAEVAVRDPDATDVGALAADVLAESTRLARIVDDLLVLARSDEGRASSATGPTRIDLDDVVLDEAKRPRRLPVDVGAVSAAKVPGTVEEWTRVVRHLLDNAARHGASRVWVGLRSGAGSGVGSSPVVLWVDDDGDGIAPADRERVFERFSRLEEARTRDGGGAGLGLAVVAATVRDLGGRVSVDAAPAGGARFVVRVPVDDGEGDGRSGGHR